MSLLDLPNELLEHILMCDGICAPDISAISVSCKRGRDAVKRSAAIWRRLFSIHFPEIAPLLELSFHAHLEDEPHDYWRTNFVSRYTIGKRVKDETHKMSSRFHHRHALSNVDMEHFLSVSDNLLFVIDALQNVVSKGDLDDDLTRRYYGNQVVRYVRHKYLAGKWKNFDGDFYDGLVNIAQWFQPTEFVDVTRVKSDVCNIAVTALKRLNCTDHGHPIFNSHIADDGLTALLLPDDKDRDQDAFGSKHSLQLLDALNWAMFVKKGFRGNTANYYNPANSYIDKVLQSRQGIPITLCLLYALVAKRLGVVCVPINFPRHFLLRWRNAEAVDKSQEFLFIDAFRAGKRMTLRDTRELAEEGTSYVVASPLEIFQRMVRNLVTAAQIQEQETLSLQTSAFPLLRSALELTKLIGGDFEYPGFALCQLYLQMNVNHREILEELDNFMNWPQNLWLAGDTEHLQNQIRGLKRLCITQMDENGREENDETVTVRAQLSEIHGDIVASDMGCFAVGMVMKHKRYNYNCVIFGWDPVCRASKAWISQMGVDKLPRKHEQPFYNVLVDDGSIRYAADENLELTKPKRIDHPQVGKYFKTFREDYGYVANEELRVQYPEDGAIIQQFASN